MFHLRKIFLPIEEMRMLVITVKKQKPVLFSKDSRLPLNFWVPILQIHSFVKLKINPLNTS